LNFDESSKPEFEDFKIMIPLELERSGKKPNTSIWRFQDPFCNFDYFTEILAESISNQDTKKLKMARLGFFL
jgi:hypothetical protein